MAEENVGDWSEATLCEYTDVRNRYSKVGDLTGEKTTEAQNTEITAVIEKAKVYIGIKLDGDLKKLYTDREFDVEDLKDLIANIEVLKQACIALALKLLFEENTIDPEDYNFRKMEKYEAEFNEFYDIGVHLVRLDIDESGAIEPEEKASSIYRYHMDRV